MMLRRKNTQRGISLIELMLSLAIIAIILVIATRYFARANLSQQINNATDQVMGIRAATNSYLSDQAATGKAPALSIKDLISAGYLPKGYAGTDQNGAGANPWNGNLSVALGNARNFTITATSIPSAACTALSDKVSANVNETLGDKVDSSQCASAGTLAVTFTR